MKTSTLMMTAIMAFGDDITWAVSDFILMMLTGVTRMTTIMKRMMTVMFAGATHVEVFGRHQDLQADLLSQSQLWKAAGNTSLLSYTYTHEVSNFGQLDLSRPPSYTYTPTGAS